MSHSTKMTDLQAIIDFQVELHKFVNIDLFSRGLYQIRVNHHINSKIPHKIEVTFQQDDSKKKNDESNITFAPSIINGVAVSKTFNILYKNEEKILNDVIHFKDHLIVDSANCFKQLSNAEFYLDVELWFAESHYMPKNQDLIRLMFRRQLRLHFDVCRGLHYYLPVTFDYFHLSTITLSVHACLVTLCLPYLSKQGLNGKTSKLETISNGLGYDQLFFGCSFNEIQNQIKANCQEILNLRQRRAQLLHWQVCSLLLASIQNLTRKRDEYLKLLPPLVQFKYRKYRSLTRFQLTNLSESAQRCYHSCLENGFKPGYQDFLHFQNLYFAKEILDKKSNGTKSTDQRINVDEVDSVDANLVISDKTIAVEKKVDKNDNVLESDNLPSIYQPEDYIATIVSDLAYICGSLIVVWQSFIKLVTQNEKINQHLSKIHHSHRCKRFSEFFFVKDKPLDQLIATDQESQLFYEMTEKLLKKSIYLEKLPVCQIECASLDGDQTTMPIIFEEKFNFDEQVIVSSEKANAEMSGVKNIDKKSKDKESKVVKDAKKDLRRSSSDTSSNSSMTDSSLNSATNSSNENSNNTNNSSANSTEDRKKQVKRTTSSKLKDRFVHNLNKLNFNGSITRRKSSISYLSKHEQQNVLLNENLSSSSTSNSNNSSLNSQQTNKTTSIDAVEISVESPQIVINASSNAENSANQSPESLTEDCPTKLIGYKGYKGIKIDQNEMDDFLVDNNGHSIAETISLNNIKQTNEKVIRSKANKNQTDKMASSESLPDLSVKRLQKTIKRMTKRNSKKLKAKKDKKESKRIKSADFVSKPESDLLFETISLNFSTNIIDSLNKNLELEDKDEFSDFDGFIDEDERIDSSSLVHFKADSNTTPQQQDKCTILEMFARNTCLVCGGENCSCVQDFNEAALDAKHHNRLSMITSELIAFVKAKESFRNEMRLKANGWHIYSDFQNQASRIPYFQFENDLIKTFNTGNTHLVICVHGLDGNSADLRLVRTYLQIGLPFSNLDFLMSESNQGNTYDSFEVMTDRLCDEILHYIRVNHILPDKVSFVAHSLGNIIVRSVLRKPELEWLLPKLHCFLSLSGPHLGTIYMTNNLVSLGIFFFLKFKKSTSLLQLCLKDNADPYKTFIYNLSKDCKMHLFKYVLLCGSSQDHYVPVHSAHIQVCNQSVQDNSPIGQCYRDMINNILKRFLNKEQHVKLSLNSQIKSESKESTLIESNKLPTNVDRPEIKDDFLKLLDKRTDKKEKNSELRSKCSKLMRFDTRLIDHSGTNALIGRQAHIAVLDCELFIEKFMTIVAYEYFA